MHYRGNWLWRIALIGAILLGSVTIAWPQQFTGRVGVNIGTDGTIQPGRLTRQSAILSQPMGGKYQEAILRGNCYYAATTTAGVAQQVTVNGTVTWSIWNPTGSGKTLRLLRATYGYTSGTLGAGSIVYAVNNTSSSTNPSGGTASTPLNALIGAANSSVGLARQAAVLVATPTVTEVLCSQFAELATTANGFQVVVDDLDGRYLLQPGNGWSITGITAAGTSPVVFASTLWEEVIQGQE